MKPMLIGSSRAQQDSIENSMVDLYLRLDLTGVGLLKFENHEAVFDRGYEAAKPAIAKWLAEKS